MISTPYLQLPRAGVRAAGAARGGGAEQLLPAECASPGQAQPRPGAGAGLHAGQVRIPRYPRR